MKIQWKRLMVLVLAMVFLGVNIKGLADEATAESRRFSVLSIDGSEAYVNKGGVREVKAVAGMPLGQGSSVRTGTKTRLYFEADDDKTIKLDSNTKVEITQSSSKKLKLTLKSGEMFFNVERPLAEDEEMTFNAAQTSMSIRGTGGVMDLHENGIDVYLIEGKVDWKIGNETVSLIAGQKASLVKQTNEALSANQMNSAYQLEGVEPYQWSDLSATGLEAALEQKDKMDLSAIGLTSPEDFEKAAKTADRLRREQDLREEEEERQREKEAESAAVRERRESGGGSSSGGGGSGGGGGSSHNTEAPTESTTAIPESTAEIPDSTTLAESGTETGSSAEESRPQESSAEESNPRESSAQESRPQESSAQESKPQESSAEESSPQESSAQESNPWESKPQESSAQESNPWESKPQESSAQESNPWESSPQESSVEESSPQESSAETTTESPTTYYPSSGSTEPSTEGSTDMVPESSAEESSPQESSAEESSPQESSTEIPTTYNPSTDNSSAEPSTTEPSSSEDGSPSSGESESPSPGGSTEPSTEGLEEVEITDSVKDGDDTIYYNNQNCYREVSGAEGGDCYAIIENNCIILKKEPYSKVEITASITNGSDVIYFDEENIYREESSVSRTKKYCAIFGSKYLILVLANDAKVTAEGSVENGSDTIYYDRDMCYRKVKDGEGGNRYAIIGKECIILKGTYPRVMIDGSAMNDSNDTIYYNDTNNRCYLEASGGNCSAIVEGKYIILEETYSKVKIDGSAENVEGIYYNNDGCYRKADNGDEGKEKYYAIINNENKFTVLVSEGYDRVEIDGSVENGSDTIYYDGEKCYHKVSDTEIGDYYAIIGENNCIILKEKAYPKVNINGLAENDSNIYYDDTQCYREANSNDEEKDKRYAIIKGEYKILVPADYTKVTIKGTVKSKVNNIFYYYNDSNDCYSEVSSITAGSKYDYCIYENKCIILVRKENYYRVVIAGSQETDGGVIYYDDASNRYSVTTGTGTETRYLSGEEDFCLISTP